MIAKLLLVGQAAAQIVGPASVPTITLPATQGLENFDSSSGFFWGKPASGDIIRINAATSAVETVMPYPSATTGLPGTGTALPNAVRFKRGDPCTLYMSFNEAGTGGAPVGPGGGLMILNVCGTTTIQSYTDMTAFGNGAPIAISDVVSMPDGGIALTGLPTGQVFSLAPDGSNPVQRVTSASLGPGCAPNGLENTGRYILITCYQFGGTPTPQATLMRWDPDTDIVTPVSFVGGYVCQADDMHFSPSLDYLVIACGDDGGLTTYSNSAIAVSTSDSWASATVLWSAPAGCTTSASHSFIGNELYGICLGVPTIYKYTLPPSLVSITSSAKKDPHFHFAHGGKADIRGEHHAVYNLLSHKNVTMNVQFEEADFAWNKRVVHGTKMAAAYVTLRTAQDKNVTLTVEAQDKSVLQKGGFGQTVHVTEDGKDVPFSEASPFSSANVQITVKERKVTVTNGEWELTAHVTPFPFAALNKGKVLIDVGVRPLYDVEKDAVAPHGLIGQTYDGDDFDFDGAIDTSRDAESTTKAQGEGAIEGSIADYKMASPFATNFAYSRFGLTSARPRDTSKLTGTRRPKVGGTASVGSAPVEMA